MTDLKIGDATILHGDCLERLADLPDASVHSVVTDPPYGLGFMAKHWDKGVPDADVWREVLRVLKPGGYLLSFFGTRTYHRGATAIEDAGFEIRDQVGWLYGTGFPKSLNVSKAIDKAEGVDRDVLGYTANARPNRVGKATKLSGLQTIGGEITVPATDDARTWDGWGTALKPAWEPIVVARKPFTGTVVANVLEHGTGAINVDACRVGSTVETWPKSRSLGISGAYAEGKGKGPTQSTGAAPAGRWPANVIHDGSDEVLAEFAKFGIFKPRPGRAGKRCGTNPMHMSRARGDNAHQVECNFPAFPGGTAARFFYCAKPGKKERNAGLDHMPQLTAGEATDRVDGTAGLNSPRAGAGRTDGSKNSHPTVKPIALMEYLIKLVTPPGGIVLDPFVGSGSTAIAATRLGFPVIGIEREAEYVDIAAGRIRHALARGVES